MLNKSYPSKVLLLGEYTVLNGSKALTIPYQGYTGKWSFDPCASGEAQVSRESLNSFFKHVSDFFVNRHSLENDLKKGLWFDSSIPHGFGLGSSGALVAAIYDAYGFKKDNLVEHRAVLAKLEDYFHGASSGLDPLVSYVKESLLIHQFDQIEVLKQTPDLSGFFLLNTGRPRQTGPLVSVYKEKMKDPKFLQECAQVLQQDVNFAIDSLVCGDKAHLSHHLWHISKFQWDYFAEMIPDHMHKIWTRGLETGDYILKLCGAGGGGFLLGHSSKIDMQGLQSMMPSYELKDLK